MKILKAIGMAVSLALTVGLFGCADSASKGVVNDLDSYDLQKYMEPIWEGDLVYNETAFILKDKGGDIAPVSLLYPIKSVISVRNFALDTLYKEGGDYSLSGEKLVITPGGAIDSDIALADGDYYFEEYDFETNWRLTAGGGTLKTELGDGTGGLTDYQIAVTYSHTGQNTIEPPESKPLKLQRTLDKLNHNEKVNMVMLGDSISAGWSASGYENCNIAPYCPPYYELFTGYLKQYFKTENIHAVNYSLSSQTSQWGSENDQITHVVSETPDLLLLAFGMNDGSLGGFSPEIYKSYIESIIDSVRVSCPYTEVILVAPMFPNPEIAGLLVNQPNYLKVLEELEDEKENVAVADVSTVYTQMTSRKKFTDLSGNNINHPNDFMHRVYAQVVVKTLVKDD